jgi:creatinine amidohydrolase/Fe(II)-dependent formamide hydrolase-like protein
MIYPLIDPDQKIENQGPHLHLKKDERIQAEIVAETVGQEPKDLVLGWTSST